MKVGDIVVFKEVLDAGDEDARMVVIEDNGDRVLVRHLVDMKLQPTSIYLKSDLKVKRGYL